MNTTLEKNIEWTTKYAARSNIFANLDRKLAIGATLLENKIKDFDLIVSPPKNLLIIAFV